MKNIRNLLNKMSLKGVNGKYITDVLYDCFDKDVEGKFSKIDIIIVAEKMERKKEKVL